ncbi:MAG TPA: hypothetical protein VGS19_35690 [Streptosporangiaceae bacterium]|nr:hypothetical protein [Streptosporangiaceae bacterium]
MNTRVRSTTRLRDANPVAPEAFRDAASDGLGRATLKTILASPAGPAVQHGMRTGPRDALAHSALRARRRLVSRLRWRLAVPAVAVVAAAAVGAAVAINGTSARPGTGPMPGALAGGSYRLTAFLTVHPAAHPGDVAAVLRQLADTVARQPTPALGPVEYSSRLEWQDVSSHNIPRNLNFHFRQHWRVELWYGASGKYAGRTTVYPGGAVHDTTILPGKGWSARSWAMVNPAALPSDQTALRQALLRLTPDPGYLSPQVVLYSNALMLMSTGPLRPAVRASMLRLMAEVAVKPGQGYRWVDIGRATDWAGRTGVAIGVEQPNYAGPHIWGVQTIILDPNTGALLDVGSAGCTIKAGAIPRTRGDCVPYGYTEYTAPKAVPAYPNFPVTGQAIWADVGW